MKVSELSSGDRASYIAARQSAGWEDYVFRCRVLDVAPLSPYALEAARHGYWLLQQPGGHMLQVKLEDET